MPIALLTTDDAGRPAYLREGPDGPADFRLTGSLIAAAMWEDHRQLIAWCDALPGEAVERLERRRLRPVEVEPDLTGLTARRQEDSLALIRAVERLERRRTPARELAAETRARNARREHRPLLTGTGGPSPRGRVAEVRGSPRRRYFTVIFPEDEAEAPRR